MLECIKLVAHPPENLQQEVVEFLVEVISSMCVFSSSLSYSNAN